MNCTRNYAFDMAKVFATVLILCHHYQQVTTMVTGKSVYHCPFDFGYMVELFFLLSGFFSLSYIRKIRDGMTFYQFYTRKVARIQALIVVTGVCSAVFLLLYTKVYDQSFWGVEPSVFGVVLQALGIQEGWGFVGTYLNSPTWYCSILMLCYLIFYGIVYWSRRLGISPFYGFVFMILLGCGGQIPEGQLLFLTAYSRRGFYAFFAGVVFAALMPLLKKWRGFFWLGLAFMAVYVAAFYKKEGDLQYTPYLLTFLVYPVALFLLQQFPLTLMSGRAFWQRWSRFTYSVFLWHFPLYVLMYSVIKLLGIDPAVMSNIPAMLLCVVVMQPVGWLSYRFLERPLNKKVSEIFASLDPARQPEHV